MSSSDILLAEGDRALGRGELSTGFERPKSDENQLTHLAPWAILLYPKAPHAVWRGACCLKYHLSCRLVGGWEGEAGGK